MQKKILWVLAVNAHKAKIFEKNYKTADGEKPVLRLIHEAEAELDTNHEKPTSTHNSSGTLRHGVEPHTDRRDVEKQKFAAQISKTLENAENNHQFESLILLASPQMLGILEKSLDARIQNKITQKLPKNILDFKPHEIEEYLAEMK